MGNLNQVGILREEYRDLLRSEVGTGGPTLEEEARQGSLKRYGEDGIINLAMTLEALSTPHEEEIDKRAFLRDAIAALDHLDTLGMEVQHKQ